MNIRLVILVSAITAFTFATVFSSEARIASIVSNQELFDKSDLIVIAAPITKTRDTGEKTFFAGAATEEGNGLLRALPAIGVETVFKVSVVLKGRINNRQFTLHHYREEAKGFRVIELDGPQTVFFDPDNWKRNHFLLFLKRETDGRYAPSGQSIYALDAPQITQAARH